MNLYIKTGGKIDKINVISFLQMSVLSHSIFKKLTYKYMSTLLISTWNTKFRKVISLQENMNV